VNDTRTVVGASYLFSGYPPRAFSYTPARGATHLALLNQNEPVPSQARGINASGTITGYATRSGGFKVTLARSSEGAAARTAGWRGSCGRARAGCARSRRPREPAPPWGGTSDGRVAGWYNPTPAAFPSSREFFAKPNAAAVDIGTLGGGRTQPMAMNDRGDVVGWSLTSAESKSDP
jgi:hypothetical protein